VRDGAAVFGGFLDDRNEKIFVHEIQGDGAPRGAPANSRCLTMPASSGISHAHAGLAKLRPPLPAIIDNARPRRRRLVTPRFRLSRNAGRG